MFKTKLDVMLSRKVSVYHSATELYIPTSFDSYKFDTNFKLRLL